MALLDGTHSASAHRTPTPLTERRIHPSICVLAGFGFIIASALAVHVVFNALF